MNFTNNIRKAAKWIISNSSNGYVLVSNKEKIPYPEVTGYTISTLKSIGFRNKSMDFANYLVSVQDDSGSWGLHNKNYIFDTAQVIDGLSEFDKYKINIEKAVKWIFNKSNNGIFIDEYGGTINQMIHLRTLACLKKAGYNIDNFITNYNKKYNFDGLSHFYAYGFEGSARLGLNCSNYIELLKKYDGLIPEKSNEKSYCFVGLSQCALSLFLCGEFDLGMKTLEFVSKFQNDSGGFYGSNGNYFPQDEISWANKFYIDAFIEGQKLWFKNNIHIFLDSLEGGENDVRYVFVKNRINKNDKVLDVGCGKGRYINRLDCDRYACDIADSSKYVNAKFSIGSCLNLPYEDNYFDKIICSECLEHAVFQINAIDEMLRILKKGGKLLIIDKDKKHRFDFLHFGEEWIDFSEIKNKYNSYTEEFHQSSLGMPFSGCEIIKI